MRPLSSGHAALRPKHCAARLRAFGGHAGSPSRFGGNGHHPRWV